MNDRERVLKMLKRIVKKIKNGTYAIGDIGQEITSYSEHQKGKYPAVRTFTITLIDYGEEQD